MNNNEFDLEKEEKQELEQAQEEFVSCPNCGRPMIKNSRYCMHCGELNLEHEKNEKMKPFVAIGKRLKLREQKRLEKIKNVKMTSLDEKGRSKREKIYSGIKKTISILIIIILLIGIINYKAVIKFTDEFMRRSYLRQVDKIVEEVKNEYIEKGCTSRAVFSFIRSDDYYKTNVSLFTFDYFTGYVEVINNNGEYEYIVSITDGKYGFKNIKYDENVDISVLDKVEEITIPSYDIVCEK